MNAERENRGVSRRTVIASAWAVPVIAVAVGAPLATASPVGPTGSVTVVVDYHGEQFDGSLFRWSIQARLVNSSDPQTEIPGPLTLRLTYRPADPTPEGQTASQFSGGWSGGAASENADGSWTKTFVNPSGIAPNGNLPFGVLVNHPNDDMTFEVYDSSGTLLGIGVIPFEPATPEDT